MGRDALGEVYTEKRGGRLVLVRRVLVAEALAADVLAEVSGAMKLDSPAILRPLDASADGGLVTIISETLEGRTLRALLTTLASNGEKLPVSHATFIAIRVLEALEHAHARSEAGHPAPVFHGRLSPEHVVLTPSGDVRVTGFGLDAAARHLLKPQAKVDPAFAYVSPEQANGAPLNAASDNFAVGSILAEALLGEPVFMEDTFAQTYEAVQNRLPPQVRAARDNVPKALDEAIAWALERNPDRRAPRPDALRQRLQAFQGMLDVGDRIKPDEHPQRLADLMRLRMKSPAAALDVTSMEPVKGGGDKPGRRWGLALLRFVFVLLLGVLGKGVWDNWRDLEGPIRARIPPAVATRLGIDQDVALPPVAAVPDAGAEEEDAGVADAGEAEAGEALDAGAPPPPRPGLLSVESTPKATVVLDGRPLGSTPLLEVEVSAGEHTLVLTSKKPRVELSQTLSVSEGEAKKLVVKLKAK